MNTSVEQNGTASRREFLRGMGGVVAAGAVASTGVVRPARAASDTAKAAPHVPVALSDRAYGYRQRLGVFGLAREAGCAVEVDLGRLGAAPAMDNRLLTAGGRQQFLDAADTAGTRISSLALTALSDQSFATHPKADEYVSDMIFIAREMGVRVAVLPLRASDDMNDPVIRGRVVARLKALAPEAELAEVVLALDSNLDAEIVRSILDDVTSPAVQACVSVNNARDTAADFVKLGAAQVAQVRILADDPSALRSLSQTTDAAGWRGWIVVARPFASAGDDLVGNCALAVRQVRSVFSPALA